MKIITRRKTTYVLEHGDVEVEVQHEPLDASVLFHRDGDKLVVGYLVDDNDGSGNPMTEYDCQGTLYTRSRERRITDNDGEFYRALGLHSYGDVDIDKEFETPTGRTSLRDLALEQVPATDSSPDCEQEDIDELIPVLYRQHRDKIIGPYVVPVSVSDYGVKPTTWDGNINRLPDGVWVADAGAIGNLTYEGKVPSWAEILGYASGVLEEYSMWCNGEVYGCVVETFEENNGYWTSTGEPETCWNFIGRDNATEVLKSEFFDPAVKAL